MKGKKRMKGGREGRKRENIFQGEEERAGAGQKYEIQSLVGGDRSIVKGKRSRRRRKEWRRGRMGYRRRKG